LLTDQLQTALDSRLVIEQAKGVVAHFGALNMDAAYRVLRRHARDHNVKLSALADAVVTGEYPVTTLLRSPGHPSVPSQRRP
jgi:AmiR/NasT family two-component response regulator